MPPSRDTPPAIPGAYALRSVYFAYLAAIGVAVPFFPPYLRGLGFSGGQIGWVLAAAPLMHLSGPLLWGFVTDRSRRPALVLRVALLGAALGYLPLTFTHSFAAVFLIQLVHQAFSIALPGLTDSLALLRVRNSSDDYGRIRVWGSFGFVVSCLGMGQWLARRSLPADPLIPLFVPAALSTAFALSFRLEGQGGKDRPNLHDARRLLADKRFQFILATASVHWACAVPYHGFLGVHVQDRGMGARVISLAFAVSVLSEMLTFFYFRHIKKRFSLSTLLVLVTTVSAFRWLVTAWADDAILLVGIQALHGVTFGVFWASSLAWLVACVPENLRATGQTVFTAVTFGMGAFFGALAAGHVYEATGSAVPAFVGAAVINLCQALAIVLWGRKLTPEA